MSANGEIPVQTTGVVHRYDPGNFACDSWEVKNKVECTYLNPVLKAEGCKKQGEFQGLDKQPWQVTSLDGEILGVYRFHLEQKMCEAKSPELYFVNDM